MNKENDNLLIERFAKYSHQLKDIKIDYPGDIKSILDVVKLVDSEHNHILIVEDNLDKKVFDLLFNLIPDLKTIVFPFSIIDQANFDTEFQMLEQLSEKYDFKINLVLDSDDMGKMMKKMITGNDHFIIYTYDEFKTKDSHKPVSGEYSVFDFIGPLLSSQFPVLYDDFLVIRDSLASTKEPLSPIFPAIYDLIKFLLVSSLTKEVNDTKTENKALSEQIELTIANIRKVANNK